MDAAHHSEALEAVAALHRTPCPFAPTARGRWVSGSSHSLRSALARLTDADDYVAWPLPTHGDTRATVHGALLHVAGAQRLYDRIETRAWTLRTDHGTFFPLLMSPRYATWHPRYLAWSRPVLMLQSEESFARRGITSAASGRARLSLAVEQSFQQSGREYFGHITRDLPKSFRVIKPASPTATPIRWWRVPALDAADVCAPCSDPPEETHDATQP